VADALSRVTTYVDHLGPDNDAASESDSIATVHSALQDASCLIPHVEAPINAYRNQLIFYSDLSGYSCGHIGYVRHSIQIRDHAP